MRITIPNGRRAMLVGIVLSAAIAVFVWFKTTSRPRVQLTLSRLQDVHEVDWIDAPDHLVVFVNIANRSTEPVWFREMVQIKMDANWGEPEAVRWLSGGPTWPGPKEECVAAVVPRKAEAVRLLVDCRHPTLYDTVLHFLNRYGFNARFPELRRW